MKEKPDQNELWNLFEEKLENSHGNIFQNIFHNLMKAKYDGIFDTPRSFGNIGDIANDGYIRQEGKYFALYGPESYILNAQATLNKFKSDFLKLMSKINEWPYEIKEFVFVVNTNFKRAGIIPNILIQRDKWEKEYQIKIDVWTQKELKEIFSFLSIEKKEYVIKESYRPSDIYSDLSVDFIEKMILSLIKIDYIIEKKTYNLTEFDSKIVLNNLDEFRSDDLKHAAYYIHGFDAILDELDTYSSEEISNAMKNFYLESKQKYNNSQFQFDYILSKIINTDRSILYLFDKKIVRDHALIIMSKYFENCTIFESEEPKNEI